MEMEKNAVETCGDETEIHCTGQAKQKAFEDFCKVFESDPSSACDGIFGYGWSDAGSAADCE